MNETIKNWPDYETLEYRLIAANTPFSISYIHGMMVGILCVDSRHASKGRQLIQEKMPEMSEDTGQISELLNNLFSLTQTELQTLERGVTLMLPPDDVMLPQRLEALADWCAGFLEGIKAEATPKGSLAQLPLVCEFLEDLTQIKELSFDAAPTQENEKDYMEIVEFVRVGVLLIHAEYDQIEKTPTMAQQLH